MRRLLPLLCLAVLFLPAVLDAQDTTTKAPRIKRNPDLISQQEVEAAPDATTTALALVQQLRPNWLRMRGPTSIRSSTPPVQVYVGGVNRGGPSALNDIPRQSIKEIQHLSGNDASSRYGTGHESGAILVILK
jgi:hypothetical protein